MCDTDKNDETKRYLEELAQEKLHHQIFKDIDEIELSNDSTTDDE